MLLLFIIIQRKRQCLAQNFISFRIQAVSSVCDLILKSDRDRILVSAEFGLWKLRVMHLAKDSGSPLADASHLAVFAQDEHQKRIARFVDQVLRRD